MKGFFQIRGAQQFTKPEDALLVPPLATHWAILVKQRTDGSLALFVKVEKLGKKYREERTVFAITEKLDPRLEQYLQDLANLERARRLSLTKITRRKNGARVPEADQMSLL